MRVRVVLLVVCAAVAVVAIVGPAQATTGAGAGLPAPKVYIDPRVMDRYVGLFELVQVDRRAKIIGSEMAIDYTELPPQYPIGRITVRHYGPDGRQASYTANLYKFQGKDAVTAQILNQGDNTVMGHLQLHDPTAKRVKGVLSIDGEHYAVVFNRYDDDDGPPPDNTVVQTGPRFTHATQAGWGDDPTAALGDYTLVNGATDPGASAGVFAAVIRYAQGVSAAGTGAPTDGDLTVTRSGTNLTGRLDLTRPSGTQTLYLTDLKYGGDSRGAVVRSGSVTGPKVGTLQGTVTDGELSATLTVNGTKTDVELQQPAAG